MGLHTGMVTVYKDTTPEGYTINLAMRLSEIAEANQIICSKNIRLSLDHFLRFETLTQTLKTLNTPKLPLYQLTAERELEALGFLRANMSHSQGLIGREKELNTLFSILDTSSYSRANRMAHCHVWGEAGIGKSRLIFELRTKAKAYTQIAAQCLPEHKHNALYPILETLRQSFSMTSMEPP